MDEFIKNVATAGPVLAAVVSAFAFGFTAAWFIWGGRPRASAGPRVLTADAKTRLDALRAEIADLKAAHDATPADGAIEGDLRSLETVLDRAEKRLGDAARAR